MMLVGEQPGDYEDVAGKPFVGPAGKIMNRAIEEAGIDRSRAYVTNAVKHFKWEPRGKRRIHQKPNAREIAACRPWLEAELRIVRPNLVVAMGATAAQAIFGPSFRVTRERGKVLSSKLAPRVLATVHPSSLLRQPDEESRRREYEHFVADLRVALKAVGGLEPRLSFRRHQRRSRPLTSRSRVPPLLKYKLRKRQISWIGDFEIEIIIQNENHLVPESLDRGNFVGHRDILCVNGAVRVLNQFSLEDLRRFHRVKLMPIDRTDD